MEEDIQRNELTNVYDSAFHERSSLLEVITFDVMPPPGLPERVRMG